LNRPRRPQSLVANDRVRRGSCSTDESKDALEAITLVDAAPPELDYFGK